MRKEMQLLKESISHFTKAERRQIVVNTFKSANPDSGLTDQEVSEALDVVFEKMRQSMNVRKRAMKAAKWIARAGNERDFARQYEDDLVQRQHNYWWAKRAWRGMKRRNIPHLTKSFKQRVMHHRKMLRIEFCGD